jgi:plastocyanin
MRTGTLALLMTLVFTLLNAAEGGKTGTVKGVITIGGKPTADAVVSVEGLPAEAGKSKDQAKGSTAVLDQREMKFIPRVLAVRAGTKVSFPNNDKTWHNVYSTSEAKKFDLGLYAPKQSRDATFEKAGVARILCNVHPGMEAFIVVKAHPYFSASDSRGNYQVGNVPLGKATLEIWHPNFGTRKQAIDLVAAGEVLNLDFDLKKK